MMSTKYFGTYIERNFKIIKNTFLQAFKKAGIDITTDQWIILDLLYHEDGVSQNHLATKSAKDAPTTSRIIDLMCKKDLIERRKVENDRRMHHIFLTDIGKETHSKILPIAENLRAQGWNSLNDEDYETFLRIMNQVYDNFSPKHR
jgi:DNA-binding MarR family transcriptional regulator